MPPPIVRSADRPAPRRSLGWWRGGHRFTEPVRRQLRWVVWGIGAGVYVLAVFHRTSLGVAGPEAAQRFSLNAAQLGSFVMLQLGVYAAMQIPTGILIDRFGPRRMLLTATTLMGAAQLGFALVHTYPLALLARGLLGCGDAMTYVSVLRLVSSWFPARRYAVLTSFTGLLGSLGNLVATLPLTALLDRFGWTATFAFAGSLSLGYALLLLRPAVKHPIQHAATNAAKGRVAGHRVWAEVKQAWKLPAGRLGFWVHLTTMTGPTVFGVLWGYPYFVEGLGYSPASASTMLLLLVLAGAVANLTIGLAVTRRPESRTPIAVFVVLACLLGWIALIAWPGGRPPLPVVVVVVVVFAVGGPASAVGFLLARDYNPRHRISTATGMVNVGGFLGSVIGVFLVGQILDIVDSGSATRSLAAFRWAFVSLAVLTAFGLTRMLTWWLRARALVLLAAARGEEVPVHITAQRWELVDAALLAAEAQRAAQQRVAQAAGPAAPEGAAQEGTAQEGTAQEHAGEVPVAVTRPSGGGAGAEGSAAQVSQAAEPGVFDVSGVRSIGGADGADRADGAPDSGPTARHR